MDRSTGTISTEDINEEFYISPTNSTPPGTVRIAVLDYSDRYNWTNERSRLAALNILDERDGAPSIDDYFLNIA